MSVFPICNNLSNNSLFFYKIPDGLKNNSSFITDSFRLRGSVLENKNFTCKYVTHRRTEA